MSQIFKDRSNRSNRSQTHSAATAAPRPMALWPIGGICLVAALWLLPEAWRQIRADVAMGPTRSFVTRTGTPRAPTTDDDWDQVIGALNSATLIAPDDASAHLDLGAFYLSASLRPDLSSQLRVEFAQRAYRHDRLATQLRPTEPRGWAETARALWLNGAPESEYQHAWELAAQLGAAETVVQDQLLDLVFATYPASYTEEMARLLRFAYTNGDEWRKRDIRRQAAVFNITVNEHGYSLLMPPNTE